MLRRGGAVVVLSARERALVLLLARHPGRLITHDELGAHAWAEHIASHDSVASAVKRVRSRLRQLGVPADVLSTVRGLGYRWDPHLASVPSTRLDEAG
jgi:two-component system KDP operon response regulator KdpE